MTLSGRLALEAASERERAIRNACSLADRPGLAPAFLSSDRGLSEVLQVLLRLRVLDQVVHAGRGAVLPN